MMHNEEFGKDCITKYLISMAEGASDILEVMVFAKEVGLFREMKTSRITCTLQAVPLFETIDDLLCSTRYYETSTQFTYLS